MKEIISLRSKPLYFLHIAKTGGTSITDAISRYYDKSDILTNDGNISVNYLDSIKHRLKDPVFIAGHAQSGVVNYLAGRSAMITVLRRPERQAVSNYLHVLSDPHCDLYPAACRQSFSDFLRENPSQLYFQANSLAFALSTQGAPADARVQGDFDRMLAFLDSLPFVGVTERLDACSAVLSRLLPVNPPIQFPSLNAALHRGVSTRTLGRLADEYRALRDDPALARLIRLDDRLYAKAQAVLDRLHGATTSAAEGAPLKRSMFIGARRFSTPQGRAEGESVACPIREHATYLVYGPYDRLPKGRYSVEFHASVRGAEPGARGLVKMDVLANGKTPLGKRWVAVSRTASRRVRTLSFYNSNDLNVLEFRIRGAHCRGAVLTFNGVTVRPAIWAMIPIRLGLDGLALLFRRPRGAYRAKPAVEITACQPPLES